MLTWNDWYERISQMTSEERETDALPMRIYVI